MAIRIGMTIKRADGDDYVFYNRTVNPIIADTPDGYLIQHYTRTLDLTLAIGWGDQSMDVRRRALGVYHKRMIGLSVMGEVLEQ
jgi:hypothetical protein